MKKIFVFGFILFLTAVNVFADAGKKVKIDLFWDIANRGSWHMFLISDIVAKRLGNDKVDLEVTYLVKKMKDGSFKTFQDQDDTKDIERMAVIQKFYKEKFSNYLTALGFDGEDNAISFANISLSELEKNIKKHGKEILSEHASYVEKLKVKSAGIFINGSLYSSEFKLLPLMEAVNNNLSKDKRVSVPKASLAKADVKPVKMWVIVSKDKFGVEDKNFSERLVAFFKDMKPSLEKVVYQPRYIASKFKGVNIDMLPFYIIESQPAIEDMFKQALQSGGIKKAGNYLVLPSAGRYGIFINRPNKKKTLDLFVMSQCYYGTLAENTIIKAMRDKTFPKDVSVNVHYIAQEIKDEKGAIDFKSLHGAAEWEENVRQLLIAKHYPDKYWDYLFERNKDYQSSRWELPAEKVGINPESIRKNFEYGKELLSEDIKIADEIGVAASPTFLWENEVVLSGFNDLSEKVEGFEKLKPNAEKAQQGGACK